METKTRGGSKRRKQKSKSKKSRVSNIGKVKSLYFIAHMAVKEWKFYQMTVMVRQHGQVFTNIKLQLGGP